MSDPILVVPFPSTAPPARDLRSGELDPTSPYITREWLVTNGLGGYASGTIGGVATRRFHGLLIAALLAPHGRTLMLADMGETVHLPDGRAAHLGAWLGPPASPRLPVATLTEFRLEWGLPVWRYEAFGVVIERRIWMPHQKNTVHVRYQLVAGDSPLRLELQPWIRFRPHEGALDSPIVAPYSLTVLQKRYEVTADGYPPLRMYVDKDPGELTIDRKRLHDLRYYVEHSRGYDSVGELDSPGFFNVSLATEGAATFVASAEAWATMDEQRPERAYAQEFERRGRLLAVADPAAREGLAAQLVLAADQFLIAPPGRSRDDSRTVAKGDEVRTVIAGYHWFTDWGRDTMISLEGLTLVTGHPKEARDILHTFADYVRDGLIPNLFPEHRSEGLYHTADATLWFFHAIDRYLAYTKDDAFLRFVLPKLVDIVDRHVAGTRFNIRADPRDALLAQGAPGYALTWMDAKVGDLVVTPRRGKAVEINALWYNALALLAAWLERERGAAEARPYADLAGRVRASFNRRFWYKDGGYLFDIVDGENGDDSSFRPNQILAVALAHPVLDEGHWPRVVEEVRVRLATPVGLRSLAQRHPDYQREYFGDLRARDLAYHQGTVWAWLIGPLVDAWMKVHGDPATARSLLGGFDAHIMEAGVGSISEIFDAEAPFLPRGCIAQAWSVAEVLRCWVKTADKLAPLGMIGGTEASVTPAEAM